MGAALFSVYFWMISIVLAMSGGKLHSAFAHAERMGAKKEKALSSGSTSELGLSDFSEVFGGGGVSIFGEMRGPRMCSSKDGSKALHNLQRIFHLEHQLQPSHPDAAQSTHRLGFFFGLDHHWYPPLFSLAPP